MGRYTDVLDKTVKLPYSLRYFKTEEEDGRLESRKKYSVLAGKFNLFKLCNFFADYVKHTLSDSKD